MAWIERADLRTQKDKVYQDYDNPLRFQRVLAIHDQHYHDGSAWQDVDESLVDDTTDGYAVACAKVRHIIRMGSTGTRRWIPRRDRPNEYVSFGRLQSWNGSTWGNVNLGTPTRTGNKIKWSVTAFDLTLTNNWHRIKLEAVLKTENARRRLRWAVTLNGLTWDAWTLVSQSDSVVVGTIEKPLAWDATQDPNDPNFVPNVTITTTYSGGYVEFGGDLTGKVLPITIDPTFTDGYGGDITTACDALIDSTNSTYNYGVTKLLFIGDDGAAGIARGLFKFVVSSIPAASTIDSATLILEVVSEASTTDRDLSVYRALTQWYEGGEDGAAPPGGIDGSTWAERNHNGAVAWAGGAGGGSGSDWAAVATATQTITAPGTFNFDVQADVADWVAGTATNYGFWVRNSAESTANSRKRVASSDNDETSYRPELVVEYTEAGGTTYEMSAVLAAVSVTPDTPNVNVLRSMSAVQAAASLTSDISALNILRSMAALQAAVSTTPDITVLNILRSMSALFAAQSATSDTSVLLVLRSMATVLAAQSATPDDAILAVLRSMAALLSAESTTPEDAILAVLYSTAALLSAESVTPDDVTILVLRSTSALLAAQSVTPDAVVLNILRSMAAVLSGESVTPDLVILTIAGIVEMSALLAAQSATSDIAVLNVLRITSATLIAQSATPDDATLAVLRSMAAVLVAVSATPDDVALLVMVLMAAVLHATSITPDDAQLSILRQVSAILGAQSVTADDARLDVVRLLVAILAAVSVTSDDSILAIQLAQTFKIFLNAGADQSVDLDAHADQSVNLNAEVGMLVEKDVDIV